MEPNKLEFITCDEYEKLQNIYQCKTEYSNGIIIMHSDTSIEHNDIVLNIASSLKQFLKGSKCKVQTEQIEVIFKNDKEEYKYKPDVFIMCEDATRIGQSYTSAPKVIFEVVSKSTSSHDYITKLVVYQKFGVLEYNIVEPNGHIVQYSLQDGQLRIANTFKDNDKYISTVFPELIIGLGNIFD